MSDARRPDDDTDRHPSEPPRWEPPDRGAWEPDREAWQPAHWQQDEPRGDQPAWQPPGQQDRHGQGGGWQAPPTGWQTQPARGGSGWAVAGAIALISLGSLMALLFGLTFLALDQVVELDPQMGITPDMIEAVRVVMGIIVVIAVLQVVGGAGSLARWQWARVIGILSGILGLLMGLLLLLGVMATFDPMALVIALVVTAGYALGVLGLLMGGAHFQRR
jgi:hypothetical protein